jgi:hypothetical protein
MACLLTWVQLLVNTLFVEQLANAAAFVGTADHLAKQGRNGQYFQTIAKKPRLFIGNGNGIRADKFLDGQLGQTVRRILG